MAPSGVNGEIVDWRQAGQMRPASRNGLPTRMRLFAEGEGSRLSLCSAARKSAEAVDVVSRR
jgi:hypothetical protein